MRTRHLPLVIAAQTQKELMAVALGIFGTLVFSSAAVAADSECLLGDNGKIAVTTFEHRAGSSRRATAVTLIYGGQLLRGELHDTNSGRITLVETGPTVIDGYRFVGTIRVDYTGLKIALKGRLKFTATNSEAIDTTFKCKVLQP